MTTSVHNGRVFGLPVSGDTLKTLVQIGAFIFVVGGAWAQAKALLKVVEGHGMKLDLIATRTEAVERAVESLQTRMAEKVIQADKDHSRYDRHIEQSERRRDGNNR